MNLESFVDENTIKYLEKNLNMKINQVINNKA